MSLISRIRKQDAVYWAPAEAPNVYGRTELTKPVPITCRWDDSVKSDNQSAATVYTDREVKPEGFLYKGNIREIDSTKDPRTLKRAYRIEEVESIPNLKNTETLFVVKAGRG